MFLASTLAAAVLMTTSASHSDTAPRVAIEQGGLMGRAADGVASFRGIPYAAPPVGPLRWRAPQRAEAWQDERDATEVGGICIQPPANGDPGVGPLPMSEDCLTLNVWTPEVRDDEPLPVMVWIHGGGLNNGSGTAALYDGANLAKRGVVVVTVNYRLGRLGFFDHPALAAERGPGEPAANYGLMDIVSALRWVRQNAAAFGGDTGNVTVFGESAGGTMVTRLMIAPEARGLFHRAVVQSGLGREEGTPLDRPRRDGGTSMQDRGQAFAPGATASQLRALPAGSFLRPAPSFYGGDLLVIDGGTANLPRHQAVFGIHRVDNEVDVPEAMAYPPAEGFRLMRKGYEAVVVANMPVLTGRHLENAVATTDFTGAPAIRIELNPEGEQLLAVATADELGGRLAFVVDDHLLSAPYVHSRLTGGEVVLEGGFTAGEALEAAAMIRASIPNDGVVEPTEYGLVREEVEATFAAGREAPVPLIIGANSAEFQGLKPSDLSPFGAIEAAMTPGERSAFLAAYGGQEGYDAHVLSDLVFNEPARHLARLHAANGHPTYLYRFDVVPESGPGPRGGAPHASDRPYVFDNLHTVEQPMGERDARAATAMADYWTTFAARGDPNAPGRPVWPEFRAERDRLLEFTDDGPVAKPVPFPERLDLIEALYDRLK